MSAKDQSIQIPCRGVVPPILPQVGRLMGPKPVVGNHWIGFSPDDWNLRTVVITVQVLLLAQQLSRHRELAIVSARDDGEQCHSQKQFCSYTQTTVTLLRMCQALMMHSPQFYI